MGKQLFPASLLLFLFTPISWANTEPEQGELLALLTLLEHETELATQNKMNADYVPGMVTLLHGSEMEAYGVTTVAEALNKVAGFYVTVGNAGDYVTIVRGIGATLSGNNLKILINGTSINRPVDASADWAMRLPITQVERIDIIRGPGAALYGEFAFSGVINIITKQATKMVAGIGSHNHRKVDGMMHHQFDSGAQLSMNLSFWDRDNSGKDTDIDNFYRHDRGHSPGKIYDHENGSVFFLNGEQNGYQLQLHYAQVERGGWYGRNAVMPNDREPRVESVSNINFDKQWKLEPNLSLGVNIGLLHTDLEHATYLPIPAGGNPGGPGPFVPIDRFRQDLNEDLSQRIKTNLHWNGFENHSIFAEVSYVQSEVKSSSLILYPEGMPPVYPGPEESLVLEGSKRKLSSVTLQDQWQLFNKLELTLGVRHDNYDDWGDATSPRLAAVWRSNDQNIFKFQYSEAFRPPTLANQYPGPNTFPGVIYNPLDAESMESTEFSYLYNGLNHRLSATIFYMQVDNLIEFYIRPGFPPEWRNRGNITSKGIELEWEQQINRDWQWYSNISYTNAEDKFDVDDALTGSVDWIGNIGISWTPSPNWHHSIAIRYTGEQEGWDSIPANRTEIFDRYATADYSLSISRLANIDGLDLKASINNITDREYSTLPNPAQYPYGLPQGGRSGHLQLAYNFQ